MHTFANAKRAPALNTKNIKMKRQSLASIGYKIKKRNAIAAIVLIALIIALYFIFRGKEEAVVDTPVVSIMPTQQENVEIYGEYVGRIRAQQFVEVRARVEGYLSWSKCFLKKERTLTKTRCCSSSTKTNMWPK